MTVGELRGVLEGLPDNMDVIFHDIFRAEYIEIRSEGLLVLPGSYRDSIKEKVLSLREDY